MSGVYDDIRDRYVEEENMKNSVRQIWMMVVALCSVAPRFSYHLNTFWCRNVAQRKNSRYPEASRFLARELLWRADHVQACDVFVHALIDDRGGSHR